MHIFVHTRKVTYHTSRVCLEYLCVKVHAAIVYAVYFSRYHNSTLHNICIDMLEDGFHQSFTELFTLVEQQRLQHERAGPSAVLLEPLIEGNVMKLEQLRTQLTTAEEARMVGDLNSVYVALKNLAEFFEQTKDTWLSDHFFNRWVHVYTHLSS